MRPPHVEGWQPEFATVTRQIKNGATLCLTIIIHLDSDFATRLAHGLDLYNIII